MAVEATMKLNTERDDTEPNRGPIEHSFSDPPQTHSPPAEEPLEPDLVDEFEDGASSEDERVFKTIVLAFSRMGGAGPAVH
jgi:hypothetical protein